METKETHKFPFIHLIWEQFTVCSVTPAIASSVHQTHVRLFGNWDHFLQPGRLYIKIQWRIDTLWHRPSVCEYNHTLWCVCSTVCGFLHGGEQILLMECYTPLTHARLHTHTFDSRHSPSGKSPPSHLGSLSHSPLSLLVPSPASLSLLFFPSVSSLSLSLPSLPPAE